MGAAPPPVFGLLIRFELIDFTVTFFASLLHQPMPISALFARILRVPFLVLTVVVPLLPLPAFLAVAAIVLKSGRSQPQRRKNNGPQEQYTEKLVELSHRRRPLDTQIT